MNTRQIIRIVVSLFLCAITAVYVLYEKRDEYITVWGDKIDIKNDDIAKELIQTDIMMRLKDVDQSGPAAYFSPEVPKFSRYEHCLGVYALLKRFNCSKKEQIAGLLHDASHTAFSHVSDFIFVGLDNLNKYTYKGYQDAIHIEYLNTPQIIKVISRYGWSVRDVDQNNPEFRALDADLPRMCADRIQYNIHTGVIMRLISKREAKELVDNLRYENGEWFFINVQSAKKFAKLSTYFTRYFWGTKWGIAQNIHMAMAIRNAMQISKNQNINDMDISALHKTDTYVMKKLILLQSNPAVGLYLQQCKHPCQKIQGYKYETRRFHPKFRGIDPFVLQNDKLIPLSELDTEYKQEYEEVKAWCNQGYDVDILIIDNIS